MIESQVHRLFVTRMGRIVGIISALDRNIRLEHNAVLSGLIQVDAAINPGNSGGPLLDSAGRLIGVTTAIYSPSGANAGLGFAVPVDTVNEIVPRLLGNKSTTAVLGVRSDGYESLRLDPADAFARAGLEEIARRRSAG